MLLPITEVNVRLDEYREQEENYQQASDTEVYEVEEHFDTSKVVWLATSAQNGISKGLRVTCEPAAKGTAIHLRSTVKSSLIALAHNQYSRLLI